MTVQVCGNQTPECAGLDDMWASLYNMQLHEKQQVYVHHGLIQLFRHHEGSF